MNNKCIHRNSLKSVCEICFGKTTGHHYECANNTCNCNFCSKTKKLYTIEMEKEHSFENAANSFEIMSLKNHNVCIRERNDNRIAYLQKNKKT